VESFTLENVAAPLRFRVTGQATPGAGRIAGSSLQQYDDGEFVGEARVTWDLRRVCTVAPLDALADPQTIALERDPVDLQRLTPRARQAAGELLDAMSRDAAVRGQRTLDVARIVKSAYRTMGFQQHLLQVWERWSRIRHLDEPACADLAAHVEQEREQVHQLTRQPALVGSTHVSGWAIDLDLTYLQERAGFTVTRVVELARAAGLSQPYPLGDQEHFELLPALR
jgi:hypothetical protein